ncbi:hypothetical protein NDN08_006350 [Rhodosorus marinus]|uniref:Uncharacterized protein n=1 Tax=Rhodosorus marinus TaxID=101924 RepID=A0AAV8UKG5_9RHOD|nr:hypothetical protein NDN08_006350 [Rhodosorus marinus]
MSGRHSSNSDEQRRDMDSDGGKKKERKKYVMTKRREYWTDEEHSSFLRALARYGREWKLIKQEVGTKTTVQIRSHAQKYFLRQKRMKGSAKKSSQAAQNVTLTPRTSPAANSSESESIDIARALLSMKDPVRVSEGYFQRSRTRGSSLEALYVP